MSSSTQPPDGSTGTGTDTDVDLPDDGDVGDDGSEDTPTPYPERTPELTAEFLQLTPSDIDADDPPQGYDLIHEIQHDHRFCANCFKRKKEVEEPPEWADINECVIGWAWPEPHVDMQYLPRHSREGREGTLKPTMVCSCGATSSSTRFRPLRTVDAVEYASNLSATAWDLHYEHRREAVLGVDDVAWRHMRIAGALAHDPEALGRAIKTFKSKPEITKLNMRGGWDDESDTHPDELYRRAFSLAAQRPPDSCLTATLVADLFPKPTSE